MRARTSARAVPELQLRSLSKVYSTDGDSLEVLRRVSVDVPTASITGIIGPSGCGKSTIARIAVGLDDPSGGEVIWNGDSRAAPRVGMVFQEPTLLPWRTLLENVCLPLEIAGQGTESRERKARQLLESVGLLDFADYLPDAVSKGMQSRTSIARALAHEPELLVLDEWTASVDEVTQAALHRVLCATLESRSTAVMLITHSLFEATVLCDRVILMSSLTSDR